MCVHKVWQFIEGELAAGRPVDDAIASAALDENWEKYGPKGHAYEADYRRDAVAKALRTLGYHSAANSRMLRPELRLKVVGGEIIVVPDHVEISKDGVGGTRLLIQDLHFGTSPEKSPSDDYYALYDVAAEQTYPGAKRRIQAMYMSDGVALEVTIKADRRRDSLRKYERAIQGILRAELEPRPSDKQCPYCSGYHICPAAEIQQVH
jgi:CRISPR/Cas system-associated exonuclease Cas4 (RecB family)